LNILSLLLLLLLLVSASGRLRVNANRESKVYALDGYVTGCHSPAC